MWYLFQQSRPATRSFPAADERFARETQSVRLRHDRRVYWALIAQWASVLTATLALSVDANPTQVGSLWSLLLWNGLLTAVPLWLVLQSPGSRKGRVTVALSQGLMSALLVTMSGFQPETHLHMFVWLAFLAVYRDATVLGVASVAAIVSQAVVLSGASTSSWFTAPSFSHWIEHAIWLAVEAACLMAFVQVSLREMANLARREAALDSLNKNLERKVERRTRALTDDQERLRRENEQLREWRHVAEVDEAETLRQLSRLRGGVATRATALMDATWRWPDASLPESFRPQWQLIRDAAQDLLNLVAECSSPADTCSSSLIGLDEFNDEPQISTGAIGTSNGPRALLLIDDPVQQTLCIHALAREGFEVDVVRSGPRAYYSVMMRDYELVLIDVDLPNEEGCDTIEAMKLLPGAAESETGLFALSATKSPDLILRLTDLDVDGLLTKPIDSAELHRLLTGSGSSASSTTRHSRLSPVAAAR